MFCGQEKVLALRLKKSYGVLIKKYFIYYQIYTDNNSILLFAPPPFFLLINKIFNSLFYLSIF